MDELKNKIKSMPEDFPGKESCEAMRNLFNSASIQESENQFKVDFIFNTEYSQKILLQTMHIWSDIIKKHFPEKELTITKGK